MKVLILNSGIGSRMEGLVSCKCLAEIDDGVTILDAQIEALVKCGLNEFFMTTGFNADMLESFIRDKYPDLQFTFIHNPVYDKTNYIYSIQLARDFIKGEDILLLHGDLVFEQSVLQDLIASDKSVMITDSSMPLPEKDFKAVITDGRVRKVSVGAFDGSVYAQPMYKLLKRDWDLWLDEIDRYCERGETGVYAENAFNDISDSIILFPLDLTGRKCFEVDNREDLANGRDAYKQMPDRVQIVYPGYGSRNRIRDIFVEAKAKKPFVVCDKGLKNAFNLFEKNAVFFTGFTSNPDIYDILSGISAFEKENCDFIVSIGGGSAIDTAKGINLLCFYDGNLRLREAPRACHLSIPTTAGTGSESTCFAVIYKEGEKHSFEHCRMIPGYVILDPDFLSSLPLYHKKSALLDALCQAIESLWAKGGSAGSRAYALSAIYSIYENADGYLNGEPGCTQRMLFSANLSGKAINISRTTAAHAMSYKLSGLLGIAHGHAVALCLMPVWEHLLKLDFVVDGLSIVDYKRFVEFFDRLELGFVFDGVIDEVIGVLVDSVNTGRLSNHPVVLSRDVIASMYRGILGI